MNYLNLHSYYSPMQGLNSPEELCVEAKRNGATHIAITDINGFYGLPEFLQQAREYSLVPIVGVELRNQSDSIVVLVRNRRGYNLLCNYLTEYHLYKKNLFRFEHEIFSSQDLVFICFSQKTLEHMSRENSFFGLTPGFYGHRDVLWAKENGFEIIANNRVDFLRKEDAFFYKLLRAIDLNKTVGQVELGRFCNESCFIRKEIDFRNLFSLYPKALDNLEMLSTSLDSNWFSQEIVSPGYDELSETQCNKLLKKKCLENISIRYGDDISNEQRDEIINRLNYECEIIAKKKFSSYFLNVEDITKQCEFTCGRGSSAASLVNFLLEITHVDPIKENLLFDRFMNLDRTDPPDIDVDFPSDQRDDVLDYIFKKFKGRAAMVANHNFLRDRSAIREVAKVMGIKEDEISYTVDRLQTIELNSKWRKVLFYANKIEGSLRHLSVHCGGVIITPGRIDDYVPVELSQKGYPVVQWEKDQTEMAGLIKTDILGNRGLSVIRDVISTVNFRGGKINYSQLNPIDDEKTQNVFKEGRTVGVVHFESPRCRTLLAAFNDFSLSTLSIVCSIIRPAAMIQVTEMLRRFRGGVFEYAHPELENTLRQTLGILVYQEDVMRVTKALANFTSQEGNELRKVLAKKHKEKKLRFYHEKFVRGCINKGMPEKNIDELWKGILSFSGYSFCKPHSDSYSLVAYKSAYLKAYYPAEFMAAVISNGGGFYIGNVEDYLNEARRMGVIILPPDINLSEYDYIGENYSIRVGLKQLKHIGKKVIKRIIGEREKGPFLSLENFFERVNPSFDEARILVKARCFSSVRGRGKEKLTHTQIMWRVYEYFILSKRGRHFLEKKNDVISKRNHEEYKPEKLIQWEQEFLNGFVTFPSWFLYRDLLKERQIIPGASLAKYCDKEVILYGQKVTQKKVSTKYKEHMSFVTFSDDTGMFNATFFPRSYEENRNLLFLGGSYLVKGKVEKDINGYQVIVSKLTRIGEI